MLTSNSTQRGRRRPSRCPQGPHLHSKLTSTQIYTRVAIRELKRVHELTHPSSKRGRKKTTPAPTNGAAELLTSLAAEAEQDAEETEEPNAEPTC